MSNDDGTFVAQTAILWIGLFIGLIVFVGFDIVGLLIFGGAIAAIGSYLTSDNK